MMRHGSHMGFGFYGSYILMFLLLVIFILIFLVLKNQSRINPFTVNILNILKEKYALGSINADEFMERKSIIEDTKYSNYYTPILLERYAKCLIDTQEFLNIKAELESNKNDTALCEQLAKGKLSYNEFKLKWRKNNEM